MMVFSANSSVKAKIGTSVGALVFQLVVAALAAPVAMPGCPETCGNITVPYPFGTRQGCFREGFNLTCDETRHPTKLFVGNGAEVIGISLPDGTVRIRTKMLNTSYLQFNGSWSAGLTAAGPLAVSTRHNRFVAMGCNLLANLIAYDTLQSNDHISVCAALCVVRSALPRDTSCSGVGCCQTPVARGLPSYGVQLNDLAQRSVSPGNGAAFIADQDWFSSEQVALQLNFLDDPHKVVDSTAVPTVLEWSLDMDRDQDLFLYDPSLSEWRRCISVNSIIVDDVDGNIYGRARCNCSNGYEGNPYIANGCQETCGNLTVPYPFGTRQGCFREGFNLTCDETRRPPKLFLGDGVEVVDISLLGGTVRIHSKMLILLNASSPQLNGSWSAGLTGSTGLLTVSTKHNRFVAMGCNLLANLIADAHDTLSSNRYVSICAALCADGPWVGDTSCSGVGCCQTPVARPGLQSYGFQLSALTQTSGESSGYGAVFIADQEWLSRELLVLQLDYFAEQQKIADSTVLEWSLDMERDRDLFWGLDNLDLYQLRRCISLNSIVVDDDDDKNGRRARCNCSKGYEGNPYIADGCQASRAASLVKLKLF